MKKYLIISFLATFFIQSCANRDGEIIEMIKAMQTQNDELKEQINTLQNSANAAISTLNKISLAQAAKDKKVDALQADLKSVLTQLSTIATQITAANANTADIKAKLDALQVKCSDLINQISILNLNNFSTVVSKTGRIWMDRNLGASQVATSPTDEKSYGYYYQWGRGNDGHQLPNSLTTTVKSQSDQPGNGLFILVSGPNNLDWRVISNPNLWQGVNGINNVCPAGFRIPTDQEWQQEKNTWSTSNDIGGFNSALKLPLSGNRIAEYGTLSGLGVYADYWSSTVLADRRGVMVLTNNFADIYHDPSPYGYCVRCIKD